VNNETPASPVKRGSKPYIIRRTQSGEHPSKVYRGSYRAGQPMGCYAQVTAEIGPGKVAVAMNGTAVFSAAEFKAWADEVVSAMGNPILSR
jgi:hypothetical protein